jgi:hypothetical protein
MNKDIRLGLVFGIVLCLLTGCGVETDETPMYELVTMTSKSTHIPHNETTELMVSLEEQPTGTLSPPTATANPPTVTEKPTEAPTLTHTPTVVPKYGVRIYPGGYHGRVFDVLLTGEGDMLIAGITNNPGLSHRITPGTAHLIRADLDGKIIWEKDYGGKDDAQFTSIIQVGEEEYVILGEIAASYVRDETDVYLIKIDGDGNEIWSHTYGGRGMDLGMMVQQTTDGGYILVGDRADEHITGYLYESNIYLIKTDAEGNELWWRTYGEKILYIGWGVAETPDGGFVLSGWEAKTLDDRDVILIKTDPSGELEWSRVWDLGERDGAFDLVLTEDGYIVAACIQSMGSGAPSAVLLKVDLEGNEIWDKLIGQEGVGNTFWDIIADQDGGYVMAGDTHLGKVPGTGEDRHGGLMVKTDSDGEIIWERIYTEEAYEQVRFNTVVSSPDGGYIFAGDVTPYGDLYSDFLVIFTDHEGNILE